MLISTITIRLYGVFSDATLNTIVTDLKEGDRMLVPLLQFIRLRPNPEHSDESSRVDDVDGPPPLPTDERFSLESNRESHNKEIISMKHFPVSVSAN